MTDQTASTTSPKWDDNVEWDITYDYCYGEPVFSLGAYHEFVIGDVDDLRKFIADCQATLAAVESGALVAVKPILD